VEITDEKIEVRDFDRAAAAVTAWRGMSENERRFSPKSKNRRKFERNFLKQDRVPSPVCPLLIRELRAHVFLGPGPTGPRPGVFFTNIQHPVCTWTYRDYGLTTSGENNRFIIISCCLFLSINVPKIKSCRLVEKRRTKVLYVDFSSTAFRF
jgi:hypothetical protein